MTTWNPVNDTRIALSNSNLTATPTVAAGTGAGVLAVYGRKTGKAYFEVTTVLTSDNSYQYSNTIGVPVVPTKTSVLGLGLATQSQTQTVPGYNWGFYGSNTEEYDADGAPLSFTGNGWTGAGPKIGSVFNWVIGTNAMIAAGARVTLRRLQHRRCLLACRRVPRLVRRHRAVLQFCDGRDQRFDRQRPARADGFEYGDQLRHVRGRRPERL
jgi:hypothetical protein